MSVCRPALLWSQKSAERNLWNIFNVKRTMLTLIELSYQKVNEFQTTATRNDADKLVAFGRSHA